MYKRQRPETSNVPDVLGSFSNQLDAPPAVGRKLKEAVQSLGGDLCDFASVGHVWDERNEREIDATNFFFASVLNWKPTWDQQSAGIEKIIRRDGSAFYGINPPYILDQKQIPSCDLWRDSQTLNVICSENFKTTLDRAGAAGMYFRKLQLSSRKEK